MATTYEYEVQGNYGQGWEMVTTEDTREAAIEQRKCYDENEPEYAHRIKRIACRCVVVTPAGHDGGMQFSSDCPIHGEAAS